MMTDTTTRRAAGDGGLSWAGARAQRRRPGGGADRRSGERRRARGTSGPASPSCATPFMPRLRAGCWRSSPSSLRGAAEPVPVGSTWSRFVIAVAFGAYLMSHIATARSVPAIHDATTDLVDVPQFATSEGPRGQSREYSRRWPCRACRARSGKPVEGDPPRGLWRPARASPAAARRPRRRGAPKRSPARAAGRSRASIAQAGIVEATATTLFFRFKDDVVVRVRPDPARPGGSIVDMRSISRVGGSDVGVNAERIRAFLADLQAA